MKPEEQIEALAKLDGFENLDRYFKQPASIFGKMQDMGTKDGKGESYDLLGRKLKAVPNYLESYDAIIPVLRKLDGKTQRAVERGLMESGFMYHWDASTAQLCELILRATNLWKNSDIK